jgi:ADP-ribose pyrophosphatase
VTFEIIKSATVFRGRVFNVHQDQIRGPDGRLFQLDLVDHRDAVAMIPIDDAGLIWFIRQYRHPTHRELLELPAGISESGESPETSAHRELREEIGMAARNLIKIGGFFMAPGYSSEYMHIFLATDLYPSPLPGDESEFLSVEKIPAADALKLAETGQLQDSKSLVALFWVRPYLEKSGLI